MNTLKVKKIKLSLATVILFVSCCYISLAEYNPEHFKLITPIENWNNVPATPVNFQVPPLVTPSGLYYSNRKKIVPDKEDGSTYNTAEIDSLIAIGLHPLLKRNGLVMVDKEHQIIIIDSLDVSKLQAPASDSLWGLLHFLDSPKEGKNGVAWAPKRRMHQITNSSLLSGWKYNEEDSTVIWSDTLIFGSELVKEIVPYGFLTFKPKTDSTDFEFLKFYFEGNVKNFRVAEQIEKKSPHQGIYGFCFDETKEYIYFINGFTSHISKMRVDADSVVAHFKIPDDMIIGKYLGQMYDIEIDNEGKIWWGVGRPSRIAYFDTKTETFTLFTSEDLLVPAPAVFTRYLFDKHIYLSEKYNNAKVFAGRTKFEIVQPLFHFGIGAYIPVLYNKILIYENEQWDSIPLPKDLLEREIMGTSVNTIIFEEIFHWSENEFAISYADHILRYNLEKVNFYEKVPDSLALQSGLLIYNLDTKEWRKVVTPKISPWYAPEFVTNVTVWNDKHYFTSGIYDNWGNWAGTQHYNLSFFVYDTTFTSIEENTVERFMTLLFDNIYPNPVTHNTVEANIWCYATDENLIEIGLYNFMGQKILDLSDKFEYDSESLRISVTFEIPKSLAKGTYFLTVRNGTETKAKGIIVK